MDLVIEENGLHLAEIKLSASVKKDQFKNLEYFAKKSNKFLSKKIISLIEKPLLIEGGIKYVPYTLIN